MTGRLKTGIAIAPLLLFALLPGCDTEKLREENEWLKKEISAFEENKSALQSEINRLAAERDEQRKLKQDLEAENKRLKWRLKQAGKN